MSYIGNQPISTAFVTDTFSGNGSTVAFTMSVAPASTTSILVSVTGVLQDPSTYSVSGTTLTFSAAPPSGTGNISVRYLGIPASGVTTTAYRTVTEFTATDGQTSFSVPSYTVGYINVYRNGVLLGSADYTATTGTTVVLAVGATVGDLVTTESFYVSSVLNAIPNTTGAVGLANISGLYSIDYLVVGGGGGGGGYAYAGGGGGGGYVAGSMFIAASSSNAVVVGAGGAGGNGDYFSGINGGLSSFNGIIGMGGGGGGTENAAPYGVGKTGGCGGGTSGYLNTYNLYGLGLQGGNGGLGGLYGGGGGGGAGANGSVGTSTTGGAGGNGLTWLNGTTYAGGGGGGSYTVNTVSSGGTGGGGAGGGYTANPPTNGTANTGGGGGGQGAIGAGSPGGNGGSGIVIIRYAGSQRGTGGTVTSSGGYTYHTFTTSGTYTA